MRLRNKPARQWLQMARAAMSLRQSARDAFEATVAVDASAVPCRAVPSWTAYWTVTESAHRTLVRAGENAGELLLNDHVVRQYTPAGTYRGPSESPQTLVLHAIASSPGHARTINLVVFDPRNGKTLQAVAAPC